MFDKVSGELGGRPDPGDTEAEHLWPVRRAAQALVLVPETDRSLPMPAPVASCVGAQKLNRLHSASGDHLPGDSFQWQKVVKAAGFCGDALGVSVFERLGRSPDVFDNGKSIGGVSPKEKHFSQDVFHPTTCFQYTLWKNNRPSSYEDETA